MFCSKCGKQSREGDKFCWNCGTPLHEEGDVTEEIPSTPIAEPIEEPIEAGVVAPAVPVVSVTPADEDAETAETVIIGEPQGDDEDADVTEVFEDVSDDTGTWQEVDAVSVGTTQEMPTATPVSQGTYQGQMPTQQQQYAQPYAQYPQGQPQQQYPYDPTQPQQMPGQPTQQQKVPWYMTTPARIALLVFGIFMIVRGVMQIGGAFSGNKGGTDDTEKPTQTVSTPDPKTTDGGNDVEGKDEVDDKDKGEIDGGEGQDIIITDGGDTIVADPDDIVIVDGGDSKPSDKTDTTTGGGDKYDSWATECTDSKGNPTAYSISELKGWQLETLCQEKGLTWDKSAKAWVTDGYKLQAFDADRTPLTDEQIAKVDRLGTESNVMYQIETTDYKDLKDAFSNLVSKVVVVEDSDLENQCVASIYGPSMKSLFVFGYERNGIVKLQFFSDPDIQAGMFDKFGDAKNVATGGTYGSNISEVFKHFTNRYPGDH